MRADFNLFLSIIFQLAFIAMGFYGCRRDGENGFFMSRGYSSFVKAFCCFSVILAHTGAGEKYCLLGCLHWIAVSLFFLFSGYGLSYGAAHKPDYMRGFYKRILKTAIPLSLVLALKAAFSCYLWSGGMGYMLVAILFYIVFFLVRSAFGGKPAFWGLDVADVLLVALTVLYSVLIQLFHDSRLDSLDYGSGLASVLALFGWGCQSLGFAYGILLARKLEAFKAFLARRRNSVILLAACLAALPFLALAYLRTRNVNCVSWTEYALRAAMVLLALLVGAVLSQGLRFGNPAIRLAGSVSAEMFLLHGFVIELLERYTGGEAGSLCRSQPGLFVVLVYLLTFLGGLVLHFLLKALYRLLRLDVSAKSTL
ncbi:MAG: hypothetical protein K6G18_04200 [Treponema sp.]|nr:hypothetical protein [Treponema sp.]